MADRDPRVLPFPGDCVRVRNEGHEPFLRFAYSAHLGPDGVVWIGFWADDQRYDVTLRHWRAANAGAEVVHCAD